MTIKISKKVTSTIKTKKIFNIDDIDVDKILVSKKEQYRKHNSFKYFIGYNDKNVIRPLYLFLSQTTGYINKFGKNKITMSLKIKDIQLLKSYNKMWKKILGSVIYAYEKYHRQIFLEECKYAKENIKSKNYIDMELESESDSDSDNGIYIDIDNEV